MKKVISLLAVTSLMVVLTGCLNIELTSPDEGTTTTSSTTSTTTTTADATWPSDFPLNPAWEVSSQSSSNYGSDVYLSVTQTCDSCTAEEVMEYYRGVMADNGWTEYSYSESSDEYWGDSVMISFDKGLDKYASIDYSVYDYGYGDGPEVSIYISYSEYYY
ncbi:hypothetical protein COW94_04265 [Candidatus Peregrinibacteria bacterium CG22_combo_CG10-13_8_21_14_all_44_10]|nr:MAG: hypothetical protein AUK45_04245 [Candidatus Peregrinibacteria bacterium CG2_30_44_17]PIP65966.1 MAG: hypothetical protein COW94_04265 [Candidatus Peregrinibacteria bacterium CG22_combo_CG10-13_8_21_14_all_44_10]PIS04535.1 MAG: hypothetical protein COT83_00075 [Candidatus Peregrinibacteria bacterium CG10_big_fil_rev_8_21_14_0_10_44_7]PIX79104.1 MAG: hypothetical protein COZ35_04095 [Candidatus Peregrinibacteria bacterium CG_4_10_14_3_um_filter_44_21]PJB89580.1 MAG: hypothetical protein 